MVILLIENYFLIMSGVRLYVRELYLMYCLLFRSSHRRCSVKIGVLKKFANFSGKDLWWSLFCCKKVAEACKFMKKRLQHIFLWILQDIHQKHLFWRTSANGCFWLLWMFKFLTLMFYLGKWTVKHKKPAGNNELPWEKKKVELFLERGEP